jgi:hypothetical protein
MECGLTWDAMDALSSTRFLTMRKIRAPSFSICWIAEENRRTPSLSMRKFGKSVESKRRPSPSNFSFARYNLVHMQADFIHPLATGFVNFYKYSMNFPPY